MLDQLKKNNREWAERKVAADPDFFRRLDAVQQAPEYLWIGCSDSRKCRPMRSLVSIPASCLSIAMWPILAPPAGMQMPPLGAAIRRGGFEGAARPRRRTLWLCEASPPRSTDTAADLSIIGCTSIREVHQRHREELEAIPDEMAASIRPAVRIECHPADEKCRFRCIRAGRPERSQPLRRPRLGLFARQRARHGC